MSETVNTDGERRSDMPGQASFHRTNALKLLATAQVCIGIAEAQANVVPVGRSRPLLPAEFRRKVAALVGDFNKRFTAIRDVEVQ